MVFLLLSIDITNYITEEKSELMVHFWTRKNTGVIYKCGANQAGLSGECRWRGSIEVHSQTL